MANWDDIVVATGRGDTAYRVKIAGLAWEFVTDSAMEGTVANAERVAGLQRDGLGFDEKVDLAKAELDAQGMTINVVDRLSDHAITQAFAHRPSLVTWLAADIEVAATGAITVESTTGFPSSGIIHIDTEAISYTGTNPTQFSGSIVRAQLGTIDQKHYTSDGENLNRPMVTNRPITLEGRRAFLYAYGPGDSLTGDGTLIWRGVCSSDASLSDDGSTWSITLDSIARLLKQDMGALLGDPMTVRGIYYPYDNPLRIIAQEQTGSARGSGFVAGRNIGFFIPNNDNQVADDTNGFFETQEEFADRVNRELAARMSGWTTSATCVADGNTDWHFAVEMTGARWLEMGAASAIDGWVHNTYTVTDGLEANDSNDDPAFRYVVTGRGFSPATPGLRGVPRGFFGVNRGGAATGGGAASPTAAPNDKLYLSGTIDIANVTYAVVTWADDQDPPVTRHVIGTIDASERSVSNIPWVGIEREILPTKLPSIRLETEYSQGDLESWRAALIADSAEFANIGQLPFLTSNDVESWSTVVTASTRGIVWLEQRAFGSGEVIKLDEFLSHELRALSCFPITSINGKIDIAQLRIPTATEVPDATLGSAGTLINDGFPSWERNAQGTVNTVKWKTGYNATEDSHEGRDMIVRDATAFGIRKAPKTLEIAQKSELGQGIASARRGPADSYADLVRISSVVLGLFGQDYYVIRLGVPMTMFGTLLGDIITFSSTQLPNWIDGDRGFTNVPALVVGRRWDLDAGIGQLSLLVHGMDLSGYAPTVSIDNEVDDEDAVKWTLTVDTADPLDTLEFLDSNEDIGDHFAAGDAIKVMEWDDAAPVVISGTVTSVTVPATIGVDLNDSWVPGADLWVLKFDVAANAVTGQQAYCYFADTTARVAFSTERKAFEFAP